jgi:hypothetical protein
VKEMMKTDNHSDIPGTRQSIERIATKPNIYLIFLMAMCGAVMFMVGFAMTRGEFLKELPEAGVVMAVGMIAFCLFFPWFTALYFARHLLFSIRKVETELQELKDKQEDTEPSSGAYG